MKKADNKILLQVEKDIEEAIRSILGKYSSHGAYWHIPDLEKRMAHLAAKVLRYTSRAAQWGADNI